MHFCSSFRWLLPIMALILGVSISSSVFGKSLIPISKWRPLTSNDFTTDQKSQNFAFRCGIVDAELAVVKTYAGSIIIKKDSNVRLLLDPTPLPSSTFLNTENGKTWLKLIDKLWGACRNSAIEYEAKLDQLIQKSTNLLNSQVNGFVAMPTREKLTRIFLVPKTEIFTQFQRKLCLNHKKIMQDAPQGVNWQSDSCKY